MDVPDLKRRVSRHFFDLVDEDANPLVVALALQDNSSVGLQHHADEFHRLHEELRQALRSRVEANYQGFNESVGVYRQVVSSLKASHENVQDVKGELEKLYEQFGNHKPILRSLHEKSIRYKRKLEILADLETLKHLPSTFETNVSQKRFEEARLQLSHALETINFRNLLGQPAIKPFLSYVQVQQTELITKLMDEIHATVYLESPYSQKRLEPENTDFEDFLQNLPALPEAPSSNPEANSFTYLTVLIQNLADLQSLNTALDTLFNNVPQELRKLCLQTSLEVVRDLRLTADSMQIASEGQTLLEQFNLIDKSALDTLARSLYAKLIKFLEAQRAISEISSRFGVYYDLDRICDVLINTVKSFLLGYIGGEAGRSRGTRFKSQGGSRFNTVRPRSSSESGKSWYSRSKNAGPVFEFGPDDEDTKGLRDFEILRESLKESIPGLLADDPHHLFAETHRQEHLEVVAPPHILNIRTLLEPSAHFFSTARDIAKSDRSKRNFDTFLDIFLRNSFVPRLQEAFIDAIDDISEDESALEEMKNWHSLSQLPIANCASQFAETVGLLIQLLDTGTSYREDYATMLVELLSRVSKFFASQLEGLFKHSPFTALSTSAGGQSGSAAHTSSSNRRVFKVWEAVSSDQKLLATMKNKFVDNNSATKPDYEFQTYFGKRQTPRTSKPLITVSDLLDVRVFKRATLLITSVRWFVLRLQKMRVVASVDTPTSHDNTSLRTRKRWTLLDASFPAATSTNTGPASKKSTTGMSNIMNATAMLAGRCLSEFDNIVSYLEDQTFKVLCSLRADTFLRVVYYFDLMINDRDFHSSNRGEERDPVVDRLQQEVSLICQVFESHLLNIDYRFLLAGIAGFMNELFILEGENISDMNEAGQNQILTNIFALQQMLTSLVSDPRDVDFSRATGFYELFRLNPTLIIEKAREGDTDLGLDDLKLLLQIRHRNASNLATSHAFGTLSTHLSQLDEIFSLHGSSQSSTLTSSPAQRDAASVQRSATKSSATVAPRVTKSTTSNVAETASSPSPVSTPLSVGQASTVQSLNVGPNATKTHATSTVTKPATPQSPAPSSAKAEAESAAQRLRQERARQLEEKRIQREHEAQNNAQAETLRMERESLQRHTSHPQPQVTQMPPPEVARETHKTSAVPAPGAAAKSPLLNHRPRFEAHHQHQLQDRREEEQAATLQQQTREAVGKPNLRVRVNAPFSDRGTSQPSPHTPDQPTDVRTRQRTPSERALDAARSVKVRQLPPSSRK